MTQISARLLRKAFTQATQDQMNLDASGLHVRSKHKHNDVYTCNKRKHKVTHASAEA